MVRALAFHQCGLGFDSRSRRQMWVEVVVGSLLAPRGFSPSTPVFPSPQQTNTAKFQSDAEYTDKC